MAWQPTPVFVPGESHGQRSLVGYSPRGHKESDMTEVTWHACNPCMAGFTSEWASLIAQLVKNPPIMQETPVQFLGQEYPLEKGKATHSSTLAWRIT